MSVSNRRILLTLIGIVVVAGISPCVSSYQDSERSYSPEGAWFVTGMIPGIPRPVLWMDTYTSDSNRPGVSGTVLCTLPVGKSPSPMGLVSATSTGHGNWIRIGKNKFALTAWRIIMDANGMAVGTAKFWGTLTIDRENEASGTLNAGYYDSNGVLYYSMRGGTSTGKRIEVEVEDQ